VDRSDHHAVSDVIEHCGRERHPPTHVVERVVPDHCDVTQRCCYVGPGLADCDREVGDVVSKNVDRTNLAGHDINERIGAVTALEQDGVTTQFGDAHMRPHRDDQRENGDTERDDDQDISRGWIEGHAGKGNRRLGSPQRRRPPRSPARQHARCAIVGTGVKGWADVNVGHALAILLGLFLIAGAASSVMRTLIAPRGLRSRLAMVTQQIVLVIYRTVAHRRSTYEGRDSVMTWAAPTTIVATLVVWLLNFFVGYALLLFGFSQLGFGFCLRESGSSLFTLGFAATDEPRIEAIDFMAAATGPIVIGLFIGYLSSLYGAYNRRETDVTLLHARAGEPNWGPELLGRHAVVGILDELAPLWHEWERWAADVGESHTNYGVLVHVRSSKPERNWLIALLSILDAIAMQLALNPDLPEGRARVALRQGFVCLHDIADSERIAYEADPDPETPIAVSEEEFAEACRALVTVGYPMTRDPHEAYPHFRGWRVNYEKIAYELARRIDAVPALWSGPRTPPLAPIAPVRPENRMPGGRSRRLNESD